MNSIASWKWILPTTIEADDPKASEETAAPASTLSTAFGDPKADPA